MRAPRKLSQRERTRVERAPSKDNASVKESLASVRGLYDGLGRVAKLTRFDSEAAVARREGEVEAVGCVVVAAPHGAKVGLAEMSDRRVDERLASQLAPLTRKPSESLSERVKSVGLQPSPVDACAFSRADESGNQTTVSFHVDDGLAASSSMNDSQKLERELREELGESVSAQRGDERERLGVSLDVSSGKRCEMTTSKRIESLVADVGIEGDRVADSPAAIPSKLTGTPMDVGGQALQTSHPDNASVAKEVTTAFIARMPLRKRSRRIKRCGQQTTARDLLLAFCIVLGVTLSVVSVFTKILYADFTYFYHSSALGLRPQQPAQRQQRESSQHQQITHHVKVYNINLSF